MIETSGVSASNKPSDYGVQLGAYDSVATASFKNIIYFIPTLFVLFVFFGLVASLFNIYLRMAYLSVIVIYSALVFINALKIKNLSQGFLFLIGLPLTHLTYGLGFLDGLLFVRIYFFYFFFCCE